MAPVVRRQVDATGLVIGREDDAGDVGDRVLVTVLFIDAENIGRRCRVSLEVVIECEAIGLAEVSDLAYAQDDGL